MKRYIVVDKSIVLFETDDKDYALDEAEKESERGRQGVEVRERDRTGRKQIAYRVVWPNLSGWCLE